MEEGDIEDLEEEVDGEGLCPGEVLTARLVGHVDDAREIMIIEITERKELKKKRGFQTFGTNFLDTRRFLETRRSSRG
jgi:hypothetical protein